MINIDLNNDREKNHDLIKKAFLNSISPVFKLKLSKEFQQTAQSCIEKVKTFYKLNCNKSKNETVIDSCISCSLTPDLEPVSRSNNFYSPTIIQPSLTHLSLYATLHCVQQIYVMSLWA